MKITKTQFIVYSFLIAAISFFASALIDIMSTTRRNMKFAVMKVDAAKLRRLNADRDFASLVLKASEREGVIYLYAVINTVSGLPASAAYNNLIYTDNTKDPVSLRGFFYLRDYLTTKNQLLQITNYETRALNIRLTPTYYTQSYYWQYNMSLLATGDAELRLPTTVELLKYFKLNPCPPAFPPN